MTRCGSSISAEILGYLKAIHAHPPTPRDRFLIVDIGRSGYVQCLLYSRDRKILCEVASGFYGLPGDQYVAPDKLPALAALGYSTDASKGNYQRRLDVKGGDSLPEIADLVIRSLHDVYGAGPDDPFRYVAPLVKNAPPAQSYVDGHCQAVTS